MYRLLLFIAVTLVAFPETIESFVSPTTNVASPLKKKHCLLMQSPIAIEERRHSVSNRRMVFQGIFTIAPLLVGFSPAVASAEPTVSSLLVTIKEARTQIDSIPELIKTEKWDAVRKILSTPPISDFWAKNAKPILQQYAEVIEVAGKDDLAVLEAREEAQSHLRFLDMAVYNNVFNPIATEGTQGATKALIRSYYEDPQMEYEASISALDNLIKIGTE